MHEILLRVIFGAAVIGSATSAIAADRVVHVYNWSDYIEQSILDDLQKKQE